MWCTNCQQDVPAIAHSEMARCAQCGRFLKRRIDDASSVSELPLAVAETIPPLPTTSIASTAELEDDWILQQRVRHLQRRLRFDNAGLTLPAFHHELSPTLGVTIAGTASTNRLTKSTGLFSAIVAWFSISTGSLAFLCGAALLIWWFIDGSRELWSLGLPLTVAGQFGLLFGLVLQLNRLWRSNRRIAESLQRAEHLPRPTNQPLISSSEQRAQIPRAMW
jgi:hypothetical protein